MRLTEIEIKENTNQRKEKKDEDKRIKRSKNIKKIREGSEN